MSELIGQLPKKFIVGLNADLVNATEFAIMLKIRRVTGKTLESIRVTDRLKKKSLTLKSYAGGGAKYLTERKKANTRFPMMKKGNRFVLVKPLEQWKKAVGFQGSDYILARSIAKKTRNPIDIQTPALKKFQQLSREKLIKKLTEIQTKNIKKQFE